MAEKKIPIYFDNLFALVRIFLFRLTERPKIIAIITKQRYDTMRNKLNDERASNLFN